MSDLIVGPITELHHAEERIKELEVELMRLRMDYDEAVGRLLTEIADARGGYRRWAERQRPTCLTCYDTGFVCAECEEPRQLCDCGLNGASENGCPDHCAAQQSLAWAGTD